MEWKRDVGSRTQRSTGKKRGSGKERMPSEALKHNSEKTAVTQYIYAHSNNSVITGVKQLLWLSFQLQVTQLELRL